MSVRVGFRAFIVHDEDGTREIRVCGRFRWTLERLIEAGDKGCTPIEQPAPRWSHYVWILRHEHGLNIETLEEKHGGPFPGRHARYVLRDRVNACPDSTAREAA